MTKRDNLRIHKKVEKYVNQIPWKPDDIQIILTPSSIEYKPINETAKYDEDLYNLLTNHINGALYYAMYEFERNKK